MKRILIVDSGSEWGGGTQSLLSLVDRLDSSRFELTAVFSHNYRRGEGVSIGQALEQRGVSFRLLRAMPRRRGKWIKELLRLLLFFNRRWRRIATKAVDYRLKTLPAANALATVVAKARPDLIYGNNQPSTNLPAMLAAEITGIPMVLHCRKAVDLDARERTITNRVLSRMICVSPSLRQHYLAQGIRADLCHIIPNGVDTNLRAQRGPVEVRDSLGLTENNFLVGTVGSLLELKRVDILLNACAIAATELPELRCAIVGIGPMEQEWRQLARRLGIAERVVFAGFREDAFDCINAFDLLVLSSRQEGMPRVILEAMQATKPVLATDVVGSRDLVREGVTGYLVPLDRPDLIAERIIRLARDRNLRQSLGEAGRRWVQQSFSLDTYATAVANTLGEVLDEAKP